MRKIILTNIEKEQIINLWNKNYSRKAIAKELSLSESAVKKIVTNLDRPYKYTGKTFGKLTILQRIGTATNNAPIVECQCECGIIKNFTITNLTNGGTVSCGCYNRDKAVSKNPWPTEFKWYIKQETTNRGKNFNLTLDQFKALCTANCFYCGENPTGKMQTGRENRNGIDRIDSNIGYTITNCVTCCWTCNRMKSNMIQSEFIKHIEKIYKFYRAK